MHKTALIHNVLPAVLLLKGKSLSLLQSESTSWSQCYWTSWRLPYHCTAHTGGSANVCINITEVWGCSIRYIPYYWQLRINLCCLLLRNNTEQLTQEKISNYSTQYLSWYLIEKSYMNVKSGWSCWVCYILHVTCCKFDQYLDLKWCWGEFTLWDCVVKTLQSLPGTNYISCYACY